MIKIENVELFGWESAIRGMRNPMNSWKNSDTRWCDGECDKCHERKEDCEIAKDDVDVIESKFSFGKIGKNDLKLMKTLSKAGNDHGKFLRMINVTMDIVAPLYWWKEFDT